MVSCVKWICYKDSTRQQCEQRVYKNNHFTQCKRIGKDFCYFHNGYYCDKHYNQNNYHNAQNNLQNKRNSFSALFGNKHFFKYNKRKSMDSEISSSDSF